MKISAFRTSYDVCFQRSVIPTARNRHNRRISQKMDNQGQQGKDTSHSDSKKNETRPANEELEEEEEEWNGRTKHDIK